MDEKAVKAERKAAKEARKARRETKRARKEARRQGRDDALEKQSEIPSLAGVVDSPISVDGKPPAKGKIKKRKADELDDSDVGSTRHVVVTNTPEKRREKKPRDGKGRRKRGRAE